MTCPACMGRTQAIHARRVIHKGRRPAAFFPSFSLSLHSRSLTRTPAPSTLATVARSSQHGRAVLSQQRARPHAPPPIVSSTTDTSKYLISVCILRAGKFKALCLRNSEKPRGRVAAALSPLSPTASLLHPPLRRLQPPAAYLILSASCTAARCCACAASFDQRRKGEREREEGRSAEPDTMPRHMPPNRLAAYKSSRTSRACKTSRQPAASPQWRQREKRKKRDSKRGTKRRFGGWIWSAAAHGTSLDIRRTGPDRCTSLSRPL